MKNLLFFYGVDCSYCVDALNEVEKLIGEGIPIEKLEVWDNKQNQKLLEELDNGEDCCGGIPFFFNQKTGEKLCGNAPRKEIRKWAGKK